MATMNGFHPQNDISTSKKHGLANHILASNSRNQSKTKNKYPGTLKNYMLDVAKKLGQRQSFYTLDLADVLLKIERWNELLPNVEIFYAMKANSDPILLRLLVLLGLSFDCATEGEIQMVLDAGASPKNILWAHTIKTVEGLMFARSIGVDRMVFDSQDELEKIHSHFPQAKLLLRICPVEVECLYDLSSKFGCLEEEALDLLKKAKDLDMKVEGISFHVGALCTNPDSFSATIRVCGDLFKAAQQIGFQFSILDIGGGFFGATDTEEIFNKAANQIQLSLRESFSEMEHVRVIAEPGCYLVGSAMQLVTTIIGRRNVKRGGDIERHYFLNNGIYGSFFKGYDVYGVRIVPLLDKSQIASRTMHSSILFGQTCCSEDVIKKNGCRLPHMETGECLAWDNMGAYSNDIPSTFCGVPLPHVSYVFLPNPKLNADEFMEKSGVRNLLEMNAAFLEWEKENL